MSGEDDHLDAGSHQCGVLHLRDGGVAWMLGVAWGAWRCLGFRRFWACFSGVFLRLGRSQKLYNYDQALENPFIQLQVCRGP